MTHAPSKLACGLLILGAAVVAGCGNDVPSGSVAKVGDSNITKEDFDKWLRTASQGQGAGGAPDPPNFTKCVATKEKQPQQRGAQKPSSSQLKKQCEQEYDQIKGEVMQFLIQAQWVQQEAEAQDVKVSDAEVKRSFEDEKKSAFPGDKSGKQFRAFLKNSGMTEADILFRVKLQTLQEKLTKKVTEGESKVTNADIDQYYEKNKKRFAQPERRDLNVVLTKTEAKAKDAKQQLDDGDSFKTVAKKFSIDDASKSQGGKLPDVAKGQQEQALDKAVFDAKRGKVEGPVKTQFGWYVFEVTKVTDASQQSLEQSRETIRNLLRSQRQQKALDKFVKDFREEYKDKTNCADDYKVAECKNGPKEKTDTGPASGGAPGGQQAPQGGGQAPPPQQAPQGGQAPPPQQAPQGGQPQAPPQAPQAPPQQP
jgi:foldase protein PrsA